MKILAILGTGRTNGNSMRALRSVMDNIDKEDNSIDLVYLGKLKTLRHCIGCDGCKTNQNVCVLKDDLIDVIEKTRKADVVLVASPIYYFGLNAMVKTYIDRTFYSSEGITEKSGLLAAKRFGFIFTYGGADVYEAGAINAMNTVKDIANYVGFELLPILYGAASDERGPDKKMLNACKKLGKAVSRMQIH